MEQRLELGPQQEASWTLQITADDTVRASHRLQLDIVRDHDDHFWNVETVPFYLVGASHWRVSGPGGGEAQAVSFPGSRIDFAAALHTEEAGVYRAATTLYNPADKRLRLIAATAGPVKAYLNGELIIQDESRTDFMPAFHRAVPAKLAEIRLPAGEHVLEIEAVKGTEPLELYVVPVSPKDTKTPGGYYFHTDVLFT
jgi:hypothetical protein